jgi:hypothetical protein
MINALIDAVVGSELSNEQYRVGEAMTDLEMTKLCENAMGLDSTKEDARRKRLDGAWRTYQETEYDPLHDDAQAMALVKKFKLILARRHVMSDDNTVTVFRDQGENRAIVECVAKMQAAK